VYEYMRVQHPGSDMLLLLLSCAAYPCRLRVSKTRPASGALVIRTVDCLCPTCGMRP
jgi:hypothetical protein